MLLSPSITKLRNPSPLQPHWRIHRNLSCRAGVSEHQQQAQQQESTTAAAAAGAVKQLLTKRSYAPARYVGPVKVSQIPGKRFGLIAPRNLTVGELLLVCPPLTVAFGAAGDAPDNDALLQQLEGTQLEPWQLQWLRVLHRATGTDQTAAPVAADAAAVEHEHQEQGQVAAEDAAAAAAAGAAAAAETAEHEEKLLLPMLQQLFLHGPNTAAAAADDPLTTTRPAAAAAAAAADGVAPALSISSVLCPFPSEQLQQIISENAYSEAAEDLGASLLRELDPESVTGLWPEYALLNHSCVPNTLAVLVGQFLLLHVTGSVLAGEELTCSYLGPKTFFSPVAARRAYLQGTYGFHCVCARCIAEQRTFPTQYYPADNTILGLNSNSSSSGAGGLFGGVLKSLLGKEQQQQQQQEEEGLASGPKPTPGWPNPSAQHKLLLQQYEAVAQELRPAVQAAAAADSRRQEQQLQLLAQVTGMVDSVVDEVSAAVAADGSLAGQEAAAAKWLLSAAYPLMQLQLEVIELLLASGDLPVDDTQLLLDENMYAGTANSNNTNSSRRNSAMAAAGAAAAARLSISSSSSSSSQRRRRQRQRQQQQSKGLAGWLSGLWGSLLLRDEQPGGPVTKRQLLGLYAEGLGRVVGVLDAVARGSESHVVACIRYMDAVRQLVGVDAEETALAEGLCARAHAARYGVLRGPEGQALLARLISARRRQLLGASLARKMSVLAWEAATSPR